MYTVVKYDWLPTGTECLLLGGTSDSSDGPNGTGNHPDVDRGVTPEPEEMQGTSEQTYTPDTQTEQSLQESTETDEEQEMNNQEHQSGKVLNYCRTLYSWVFNFRHLESLVNLKSCK